MSTREKLRRSGKPKIGAVEYEGESYPVRGMTGTERGKYMDLVAQRKAETKSESATPAVEIIAAFGLCEPDGALSFDYTNAADIEELSSYDSGLLQACAMKLFELSGLAPGSGEAAEKK